MRIIAMIPARIGSQRVKRKALRHIAPGLSLLGSAVQRCWEADCFDEIWVTTHGQELADEAARYGAKVHIRPESLTLPNTNTAFKVEFLERHECDWCVNVGPPGPCILPETIGLFVDNLEETGADIVHTVERMQGCFLCNGEPVNFDRGEHSDTQDLPRVWHVTWGLIGMRREAYLADHCMWPAGRTAFYELHPPETCDIDTEADLEFARYCYARQREHLGPARG